MKKLKKIVSKEITFTNIFESDIFPPKPAVKEVPGWYINTPEYIHEHGKKITNPSFTPHTIKKCIPVFDSITAGYILYTPCDVQVTHEDGLPYYTWSSRDAIDFHPLIQAPLHPTKNDAPYPKWINPWAIKTPKGYSTLFVQPFHRESIFTILPGIVDTDSYTATVNFPFVLNDVNWEGMIPAGTPMAQVIPFKRDSWIHGFGSYKELKQQEKVVMKLKSLFFNSYKRQFWNIKSYK
jgi:hypothetical protein